MHTHTYTYTYISQTLYSFIYQQINTILAIVNNAAVNLGVQ